MLSSSGRCNILSGRAMLLLLCVVPPSCRSGHEKYFRTTAYGLTGHLPDYACLLIGANMGVVGMCKEHLGVALALKVPVFFVVTKVDICPEHVLKSTVQVGRGTAPMSVWQEGGQGTSCAHRTIT